MLARLASNFSPRQSDRPLSCWLGQTASSINWHSPLRLDVPFLLTYLILNQFFQALWLLRYAISLMNSDIVFVDLGGVDTGRFTHSRLTDCSLKFLRLFMTWLRTLMYNYIWFPAACHNVFLMFHNLFLSKLSCIAIGFMKFFWFEKIKALMMMDHK